MEGLAPEKQAKVVLKILHDLFKEIKSIRDSGKASEEDPTKFSAFRGKYLALANLHKEYIDYWNKLYGIYTGMDKESEFPIEEKYLIAVRGYLYESNSIYESIMNPIPSVPKIGTPSASSTLTDPNATLAQSLTSASMARYRLPKINIPTFEGDLSEWIRFRDVFMSIVHEETSLAPIEKFYHLLGCLRGEPLRIVSAFPVSATNYDNAWKALKDRYDNRRILAAAYLHKAQQFKPSTNMSSNPTYLRSFLKTVVDSFTSLTHLAIPNEGDFIKLQLALECLDGDNRKLFEERQERNEFPTFQSLVEFIQQRCKILELSETSHSTLATRQASTSLSKRSQVLTTFDDNDQQKVETKRIFQRSCPKCKRLHLLFRCYSFKNMPYAQRLEFVTSNKICSNCLREGHDSSSCLSKFTCYQCQRPHHSLLHDPTIAGNMHSTATPQQKGAATQAQESDPISGTVNATAGKNNVLLGTAVANVADWRGELHPLRIVIDSGSQFSIITEHCVHKLNLPWKPSKRILCGIGLTQLPTTKGRIECTLFSTQPDSKAIQAQALVMPSLTPNMPSVSLDPSILREFKDIKLADDRFWESRPIDFLLGADLLFQTVSPEPMIKISDTLGTLPTIFGHVVVGVPPDQAPPSTGTCLSILPDPFNDLKDFWEIENVPATTCLHPIDAECENYFKSTIKRDPDGRYVVSLPLRNPSVAYPTSRNLAMARLRSLELKLIKQPSLRHQYNEFMHDYLTLNHMEETSAGSAYVIPHHAVFKTTEGEPKIRVVFDASMDTPSRSLNDNLLVGPKLQRDISVIILNFRRHRIALCTDIVKMFRQIMVTPEHRRYQHILWRFSSEEAVKTFELRTLTYGQSSSPYLALRVLRQLADDEGKEFPKAAAVLRNDIYVDDIITGTDSAEEAIDLKDQLIGLLEKGGFPVHKWASNSLELLNSIPTDEKVTRVILEPEESTSKVLGLQWNARTDCFYYKVQLFSAKITKRSMLSTIARLYDPLGFLAPVIFSAKCMIQSLWLQQLDWDDSPPASIVEDWNDFVTDLPSVQHITIPRWLHIAEGTLKIFGFCDASEKGFAAVAYLQVVTADLEARAFLLASKTRLAPLKTLSIPRLELCAAHLLTKVIRSLAEFRQLNHIEEVLLFTDSTIVLSWLRIQPALLKTFVANRIGYILTHTDIPQWHHVPSCQNPADIASRGIKPSQLGTSALWWMGPNWINELPLALPESPNAVPNPPERRSSADTIVAICVPTCAFAEDLIERFSQYLKLIRTVAYVFRFKENSREPKNKTDGPLTASELESASLFLISQIQHQFFQDDYDFKTKHCKSNRFRALAVFEDTSNVLRVGGRLSNATLPHDTKHPILLPSKAKLTAMIADYVHQKNFHLGPQALQACLTRKYHIFGIKGLVRKRVWKCLRCFKLRAKPNDPFMANLPSSRVTQGRPFISVGVDFAGPFTIKQSSRRNAALGKAYLSLFVCMKVKAVHLEVVSDLSTNAFLAAFDRFVARRGLPTEVRSDCGTNFIGAARHLKELFVWCNDRRTQEAIGQRTSHLGIQWHFNPPSAPHFGGIWEAAVKSAKTLLKRTIGDRAFQFEELSTIFTQIEAVLNSRPLCPLTSNPDNYDCLTPGHFLIGSALIATPQQDTSHVNINRLSRWQLLQNSVQIFWKRWTNDYIHTLQARTKWTEITKPVAVNDLVLLQEANTAPLQWKLGRILELHPGKDGIIRVVTVKTARGLMTRPVHKLAPLSPLNQEE